MKRRLTIFYIIAIAALTAICSLCKAQLVVFSLRQVAYSAALHGQTITFAAPPTLTYGTPDYSPGATATSLLTVTYSSDNTAVATIVANKIHITGAGSCSITASQPGNGGYWDAAPDVIQPLTVIKANQLVTFPPIDTATVGAPDFDPGATSTSGLTITLSSSTDHATIVGGLIHPVSAGNTVITASQPGDGNYNAAISVTQPLVVVNAGLPSQTITLPNQPTVPYGTADFSPLGSASSGLPVTYTTSDATVFTIVAGNVHVVGPGTANITANQAGNLSWAAAPPVTKPITITKANQTLTFNPLSPITTSTPDYSPGATSSSGLTPTYTSSATGVATIASNNIHPVGAGSTNITASQSGNADYNAASPVIQPLTVTAPIAGNVDTTYEALSPQQFMQVDYDASRPNKQVTLSAGTSFSLNNVPAGAYGNIKFTITGGTIDLILNGLSAVTPSTPGTYILGYINNSGLLTWSASPYTMPVGISPALIQPNAFTFTAPVDEMTSAGVYDHITGNLIRTLWSLKPIKAGTHNGHWDGLDDDGNQMPFNVSYDVKVSGNTNSYNFLGTVGNNSDSYGVTHWRGGTQPVCLEPTATNMFVGMAFSEVAQAQVYFNMSTPRTMVTYKNYSTTYAGTVASCSNATYRFWGLKDYQGVHNFVTGELISNNSNVVFSAGTAFTGTTPQSNYASVLDLNSASNNGIVTGMAVQSTASTNQYLFIAHGNINQLDVLAVSGSTGTFVRSITLPGITSLKLEGDNVLWVGTATAETKYTVNTDGTLTATGTSITGFQHIVSTDIQSGNMLVEDAGTNQDVKEYNTTTLALVRTIFTPGGYSTSPTVSTSKLYIADTRGTYMTCLRFQPDGTWWVSDAGNGRLLHMSATGTYIENILYFPEYSWMGGGVIRNGITYNTNIVINQNSSVFNDFLEYKIDYTKSFNSGFWTLKNNWGYNLPAGWHNTNTVQAIDSMANGRRYMILNGPSQQMAELTTTGLRIIAGALSTSFLTFDPLGSGNMTTIAVTNPTANASTVYSRKNLTGFDGSNNPLYSALAPISTIATGYQDPVSQLDRTYNVTSSGAAIIFQSDNKGSRQAGTNNYHLAGYNGVTRIWRSDPSTFTPYTGDFPDDNKYDIGNSVNVNAAARIAVTGNHIVEVYHGEFWKATQTGKIKHWNDIGLLQGECGFVVPQFGGNGSMGTAGIAGLFTNCLQANATTYGGNVYSFFNDESINCGISSWEFVIGNNNTTTTPLTLLFSPFTITPTRTDLLSGVPNGQVTVTGTPGWAQFPATDNKTGAMQLYSTSRKNQADFNKSADLVFNGQGNTNVTYYESRTLTGLTNLSAWQVSGALNLSVNAFQGLLTAGRFYMTILDVNGKVLARFEPYTNLSGGSHNSVLFNNVNFDLTNPTYGACNYVIARAGSQVHLFINVFGQLIDTWQNIYDGTADIINPLTIKWSWQFSSSRSQNMQIGAVKLGMEGK